ncbi:VOC family protein [Limibacter armeniacum]|uniref:VOC family protein n=1 Tax=Limibacter armeniacum TaxID=466084 RepID=UPI002FE5E001
MKINQITILLLILFFQSACQSTTEFPGISSPPTATYQTGRIVWRDLVTPDAEAARKFYQNLFGWTYTEVPNGKSTYTVIHHNNIPIGGIFQMPDNMANNATGEWVVSISVPDVKATVNEIGMQGAQVVLKTIDVGGRGTSAVMRDAQGAVVGLVHSASGDPKVEEPVANNWLWTELWSNDTNASIDDYKKLLQYEVEKLSSDGKDYWLLSKGQYKCGAIIQNPVDGARSHWVSYVKVMDVKAIVETAKKSGGTILMEPTQEVRSGKVAVIIDPGGAPLAIQEWE